MAAVKNKNNNKFILILAALAIVIGSIFVYGIAVNKNPVQPQIVIIPVYGEISLSSTSSVLGETSTDARSIANDIQRAVNDPNVDAIIIEINSPGGGVVASEEISREISKSKKPVVAWMREVAASGGYWIAASTDYIVADPATITGSIGVSASYLEFSGLMQQYGIGYERIVTGEYKDIGTPYREPTEKERILLQQKIEIIKEMFIQQVADGRNMSTEAVRNIATGEIFLGEQAKSLGLVDQLGGADEAKAAAEMLADVENAKLVTYKKKLSLLQVLSMTAKTSFYQIGLGIGNSWSISSQDRDYSLKAELG